MPHSPGSVPRSHHILVNAASNAVTSASRTRAARWIAGERGWVPRASRFQRKAPHLRRLRMVQDGSVPARRAPEALRPPCRKASGPRWRRPDSERVMKCRRCGSTIQGFRGCFEWRDRVYVGDCARSSSSRHGARRRGWDYQACAFACLGGFARFIRLGCERRASGAALSRLDGDLLAIFTCRPAQRQRGGYTPG